MIVVEIIEMLTFDNLTRTKSGRISVKKSWTSSNRASLEILEARVTNIKWREAMFVILPTLAIHGQVDKIVLPPQDLPPLDHVYK